MFLCDDCHDNHPNHLICGMVRSLGRCEGCGVGASCNDCHYTSPEVKVKVAQMLAELHERGRDDG